MIDWSTAIAAAAVTAVVNFLGWMLLRRTIERLDADNATLKRGMSDLAEKRVATIERMLAEDGAKRKGIYEGLEHIRLNWMSKEECRKQHEAAADQSRQFLGAVLKLERVSTEVSRLVSWVDDVSKEQISHGKDLAALAQRIENLAEDRK